LRLSLTDASNGILRIAATTMANVAKRVTTERGLDAGEFAMVAYGGAGPLHAGIVARELRIPTVVIPPSPGHFSAYGMLMADLRRDFVRTWFKPVKALDFDELERLYRQMEADGMRALRRDVKNESRLACSRAADMRYVGQEHPVRVELPAAVFEQRDRAALKARLDEVHMARYGFSAPREPAEIVSLHSSVVGLLDKPRAARLSGKKTGTRKDRTRKVYFQEDGGYVETPVFDRSVLAAGERITGPALVEEYASTTVVLPGDVLEVGEFGDLVITIARS
jgi:N-methylhydantoinase A